MPLVSKVKKIFKTIAANTFEFQILLERGYFNKEIKTLTPEHFRKIKTFFDTFVMKCVKPSVYN